MKVVLAGATGLIGTPLCSALAEAGHTTTALVRDPASAAGRLPPNVAAIPWRVDAASRGLQEDWQIAIAEADAVINLAGEPLTGRRWSPAFKDRLRRSRLDATGAIVRVWQLGGDARPVGRTLLNASAVGYYGDTGDEPVTESTGPGEGFLPDLCAGWEAEALEAASLGARVVLLRTGLVLSMRSGLLPKMMGPMRLFVGGPLGSGRQWMPWIHLEDEVRMIVWAMENPAVVGPLNLCSPNPVTMRQFVSELGRTMGRPAIVPVPGFVLKAVVGEMAEAILSSQRVMPANAQSAGFVWKHPDLPGALRDLVG